MNRIALLLVLVATCGIAAFALQQRSASATSGPCNPASAAITGEESQFLGLAQQWRNANVQNSVPLQLSAPLDAAAAWFAEYEVANGLQGGHLDNLGRNWAQRAADCGYDSYYSYGSGEGIYARAASAPFNVGPSDAIAGITYPGSGIHIATAASAPPPKCVGVAVARNQSGTAVAWVLVIAQYPASQQCPQAVTGGSPSPSPSPSATNTPTATPTKTPTPTPTPTPSANYNGQLRLSSGWNLVTLPVGPLADILDTARGCFSAVYQMEGDHWRRYVPDAPGYASNLANSSGGAFWVLGTDANCGLIRI